MSIQSSIEPVGFSEESLAGVWFGVGGEAVSHEVVELTLDGAYACVLEEELYGETGEESVMLDSRSGVV